MFGSPVRALAPLFADLEEVEVSATAWDRDFYQLAGGGGNHAAAFLLREPREARSLTAPATRGTLGAVKPTTPRSELLAAKVHVHPICVRYGETDQMGVVHHSNYALYLEEARTAFMRDLGCSYAGLEREGIGLAVRRMELRFRAPARYDDEILVHTRVTKLGAASVLFEYELFRAERAESHSPSLRLAEARTELACIDLERLERPPRPRPESLRALLEPLL